MAGNHRLPAKTKGRDTVDAGDRSPSTTITDVGDGTSKVGGENMAKAKRRPTEQMINHKLVVLRHVVAQMNGETPCAMETKHEFTGDTLNNATT